MRQRVVLVDMSSDKRHVSESSRFNAEGRGSRRSRPTARPHGPTPKEFQVAARYRRGISLIGLIYILIGIYVAWVYDYITPALLKDIAEALLAVFLWFLILLGVDLRLAG